MKNIIRSIACLSLILIAVAVLFCGCGEKEEPEAPKGTLSTLTIDGSEIVTKGCRVVARNRFGTTDYASDVDLNTAYVSGDNEAYLFFDLGEKYILTGAQVFFADTPADNWEFTLDIIYDMPFYGSRHTTSRGNDLYPDTIYDSQKTDAGGNEFAFTIDFYSARYLRLHVLPNESVDNVMICDVVIYGYPDEKGQQKEPGLSSILLNGSEMASFVPDLYKYHILLPYGSEQSMSVDAVPLHEGEQVSVTQAGADDNTAVIKVSSADGKKSKEYEIVFVTLMQGETLLSEGKQITGSQSVEGHGAENALDGDVSTCWTPEFSEDVYSLTVDLGEVSTVTRLLYVNLKGKPADIYNMAIDASTDGQTFTRVYNSHSGIDRGQSINIEFEAEARYIRVNYFGLDGFYGDPVDVNELAIFGIID